ncbi:Quinone oxidoreductase 1 [Arthrobacter sp. SO3]|nr:Quinone oxidoreductase 1 [Arthrobacter sp. SO3]
MAAAGLDIRGVPISGRREREQTAGILAPRTCRGHHKKCTHAANLHREKALKAVQFAGYGGPEVLKVVDIEEPHARAGQIRIAVRAAGVNAFDWKIRSGALAAVMPIDFPAGVGMDASGVVDEVGDGVEGVAVGDAVFGTAATGATAQYAVLAEWAKKPESLSFEEAAGYPMSTETACRALNLPPLEPGQTLLVNGAAGGVGLAAVQFALAGGATVIGTASEGNHEYLRSLGAIPTTYGPGLVGRVRELAPHGVDVAFDAVGSGILPELIELTGSAGKVITIADSRAAEYGVRFTGGQGPGHAPEARAEAAALFEQGKFRLPVAETFSLENVAAAQAKSEQGHVLGKYIVTVN